MISEYISNKKEFESIPYLFAFTIISNIIADGIADKEKIEEYNKNQRGELKKWFI